MRATALIGAAQRIEHYEIAAYGCARTYARRLNRPDEARLLQETLADEGRADHRLTEIAEAHVNDDARTERDLREAPPRTSRLRFVAVTNAANGDSGRPPLPIRNDENDDLGAFDGLVVEAPSDRPRYVVVDGGGVFARRRYLLPIDAVRAEGSPRVLRVALPKDIAERYPPFDPDQFQAMSDSDVRRYEAHLVEFFPRRSEMPRSKKRPAASEPEWLMTGEWVTVPPEKAEQLTDEARSVANEFVQNHEHLAAPEQQEAQAASGSERTPPPRHKGVE